MEAMIEMGIVCPYCGETYPAMIDASQGSHTTIEDCAVCCQPIQLDVRESGNNLEVAVSRS
jgi:hypothetical protein